MDFRGVRINSDSFCWLLSGSSNCQYISEELLSVVEKHRSQEEERTLYNNSVHTCRLYGSYFKDVLLSKIPQSSHTVLLRNNILSFLLTVLCCCHWKNMCTQGIIRILILEHSQEQNVILNNYLFLTWLLLNGWNSVAELGKRHRF